MLLLTFVGIKSRGKGCILSNERDQIYNLTWVLDYLIPVTITTSISTTFDSFDQFSWVGTTFSIGSSISQPLSGHLTDVFGRRAGLVACYLVFLAGTLLCGLSSTTKKRWVFYVGRILQGLGG